MARVVKSQSEAAKRSGISLRRIGRVEEGMDAETEWSPGMAVRTKEETIGWSKISPFRKLPGIIC